MNRRSMFCFLLFFLVRFCWGEESLFLSEEPQRLGILVVGDKNAAIQTAVALLQRRLQRSVDRTRAQPFLIEGGDETRAQILLQAEWDQTALREALPQWEGRLFDSADLEPYRKNMAGFRERLAQWKSNLTLGPLLRRAWLLDAAWAFRTADRLRMKQSIRRAFSLNPTLPLEPYFRWEEQSPYFQGVVFDEEVEREVRARTPPCRVKLTGAETALGVTVNGFAMPQEEWSVEVGVRYLVRVQWAGGNLWQKLVSCPRAGLFEWAVSKNDGEAQKPDLAPSQDLSEIAQRRRWDSLLLVRPEGAFLSFSLYATDGELVRVEPAIRVSDLMQASGEGALVPLREAIVQWMRRQQEKRKTASVWVPPSTPPQKLSESVPSQWYNHWSFWAIAGALGGAAVLYFSQNETLTQNQPNGVVIHFE